MKPKIKICGVTSVEEIKLLETHNVTYAGLWHGIPEGRYDLQLSQLKQLVASATDSLEFLLVTMSHDLKLLAQACDQASIKGIQFHGFHLPAFINQVKQELGSDVKIFKVLHVQSNRCVESNLIERYIEAGTDYFILDTFQNKQQIGSTGIRLADDFIKDFFHKWKIQDKTMIAGGIDETCLESIYESHKPFGFDIDSAARTHGVICKQRLSTIMRPSLPLKYA